MNSQLRSMYADNSQMMMKEQLEMSTKHYTGDLKKRLELKWVTNFSNAQEVERNGKESKSVPGSRLKRARGKIGNRSLSRGRSSQPCIHIVMKSMYLTTNVRKGR